MKANLLKWSFPTITAAVALLLPACQSTHEREGMKMVTSEKGVPGGVYIETATVTATVIAIDASTRKLTLATPNGKRNVFRAGPEVVNFPQIQIGDKVRATVTEELVVSMANDAPAEGQGEARLVALPPHGARPGGLMAETVQVKAKITALDLKTRKATLQFPDGSTHKVAVRPDIDMTQRKLGEEVIIRATESVAITVDKS